MKGVRWLRELHLALGVFVAPFALLYATSALQMAHPRFAGGAPTTRIWETTLADRPDDPVAVHEALRAAHDVRGELVERSASAESLQLRVVRPGRRYQILVTRESGLVRVTEERASLAGLLNRLHHASGVWKREPAANAWGFAVVLVSTALPVLVVTGSLLSGVRRRERRAAAIVLTASLVVAIGLLISIRNA